MELLVGALVVLGFLAILGRFMARDPSGEIVLPRVIDESIGMWVLRRVTGRRLWERAVEDGAPPTAGFDPRASDSTPAALGSIALPRSVGAARRGATFPVSRTPVGDLRRRHQATRPQLARPRRAFGLPRAAAYALAAAVVVVCGVALGAFIGRPQGGQVLATTAQPSASQVVVVASPGTPSGSPEPSVPAMTPGELASPKAT